MYLSFEHGAARDCNDQIHSPIPIGLFYILCLILPGTAVYSSVVVPICANIIQYPNVICVCRFLRTRSNRLLASGASGAGARDHGGSSGTNNSQHFAEVHHLESVESVYRLSPISCGLLTLYRFEVFEILPRPNVKMPRLLAAKCRRAFTSDGTIPR